MQTIYSIFFHGGASEANPPTHIRINKSKAQTVELDGPARLQVYAMTKLKREERITSNIFTYIHTHTRSGSP